MGIFENISGFLTGNKEEHKEDYYVLLSLVVEIALEELGRGEQGFNNSGPDVVKYRNGVDSKGAWCAAFICWCFEEACRRLQLDMPFQRSNGAKKLSNNIKKAGTKVRFEDIREGDVVCWNRGKAGSWKGHVGLVVAVQEDSGIIFTIEGNVGKVPSKVAIFAHDLYYENVYQVVRLGE